MEPIPPVDLRARWRSLRDGVLAAVERVGDSGHWILGPEVEAFERALAPRFGTAWAVGCASGLDALELGLRCVGVRPGTKVLTTPLSAFATSLAVLRAGGTPVFVDVDASGQLDLELCAAALEADSELRTLLPVHLYGHALDLDRLEALRERFGLALIEDCAQAIGAESRGRPVGSVGDVAATSFYPTKNLGAIGDGGALLTNDGEHAELARSLRDYGQGAKFVHERVGMNSRLDELHAAILREAFLPALQGFTDRRTAIAERYLAELEHGAIHVPPVPEASRSVWHLFPVIVEGDRGSLGEHLRAAGIVTGTHYPHPIPDQPALAELGGPKLALGPLENARRFAERELSLPIHPFLSDEEVDRVVEACNGWPG